MLCGASIRRFEIATGTAGQLNQVKLGFDPNAQSERESASPQRVVQQMKGSFNRPQVCRFHDELGFQVPVTVRCTCSKGFKPVTPQG